MKCIILCAGQGTRLRPLTDHVPKCMVELLGKPLLRHQLDSLEACGLTDVHLVTGYRAEKLQGWGSGHFHNPRFASTNMVASLFEARELFDGSDDLIVAYSDIVYEPRVIEALRSSPGQIATVVDRQWLPLWSVRMDDPLSDAETLRLNDDGTLREIGLKPRGLEDIEGQYVGLIRIAAEVQPDVLRYYDGLSHDVEYDGRSFDQMFMTSFLTGLMGNGMAIVAAMTDSGWLEVDTLEDLASYEALQARGELARFWKPVAPQRSA
jgi:L-glutamine-phosphate cytidylyltransferase